MTTLLTIVYSIWMITTTAVLIIQDILQKKMLERESFLEDYVRELEDRISELEVK